jgi:Helix-hairpin-helix motif
MNFSTPIQSHPNTLWTPSPRGWSSQQQMVLGFFLCLLLVFLLPALMQRLAYGDTGSSATIQAGLVELKIDPNTADYASLIRLPGIGPGRARRLLAYREARSRALGSAQPVFTSMHDLELIPDFGPKTVANMAPLLMFGVVAAPAQP